MWKKGESGNPNGQPKKDCTFKAYADKWSKRIKKTITTEDGETYTMSAKEYNIVVIMRMIQNNETPDPVKLQAIKLFLEYTEGKPQPEVVSNVTVQNVQDSISTQMTDIKKKLDTLTPQEREEYFKLCEKLDGTTSK